MKKFYVSFICSILMLSMVLAGCSTAKTDSAATTAATTAAAATIAPAATAAATAAVKDTGDAFTIRIGGWFIDDRQFMKDFKANVEKKFKEKYPNATVQWDILLGATYFDKLKAELASDTAPDVFFHQNTVSAYADAGYLVDLSDQPWASQLNPATKPATVFNGKTYGASLGLGASGIWYNKAIFDKLSLTPPKTWSDFMALLDKVKAANIIPIGLGFKDAWTAQMFYSIIGQSVLEGTDPKFAQELYDGTKKVNGPEMQSVFAKIQDMTAKGYFNKTALTIDWPQSADLFTSGQSAMIAQGSWMPGAADDNFTKKGQAKFEVGYFPIPDDAGNVNLAVSAGETLSVNAKTKLMQQSKDLISVILSEDVLGPFSVGNGSIPAISGMKVSYPYPALNELLAAIAADKSGNDFNSYISTSATTSLTATTTKIVSGAKFDPADLQDAQDKMDKDKAAIVLPAQ